MNYNVVLLFVILHLVHRGAECRDDWDGIYWKSYQWMNFVDNYEDEQYYYMSTNHDMNYWDAKHWCEDRGWGHRLWCPESVDEFQTVYANAAYEFLRDAIDRGSTNLADYSKHPMTAWIGIQKHDPYGANGETDESLNAYHCPTPLDEDCCADWNTYVDKTIECYNPHNPHEGIVNECHITKVEIFWTKYWRFECTASGGPHDHTNQGDHLSHVWTSDYIWQENCELISSTQPDYRCRVKDESICESEHQWDYKYFGSRYDHDNPWEASHPINGGYECVVLGKDYSFLWQSSSCEHDPEMNFYGARAICSTHEHLEVHIAGLYVQELDQGITEEVRWIFEQLRFKLLMVVVVSVLIFLFVFTGFCFCCYCCCCACCRKKPAPPAPAAIVVPPVMRPPQPAYVAPPPPQPVYQPPPPPQPVYAPPQPMYAPPSPYGAPAPYGAPMMMAPAAPAPQIINVTVANDNTNTNKN